jgi:hypothetical protein
MPISLLLYDVESFPNEGWTWGTWEQKVIEVIERRMVCSISWQWYPQRERHVLALPDLPGYDRRKRTNVALIKKFTRDVMDKADIVVGHNVDEFDDKRVNSDIFLNKIVRPPPHRSIDTLKVLRRNFDLNSNRLGDVCEELGIGKKMPHPGFRMWKECMAGRPEAWQMMKRYNLHDVSPLLRGLYEHLRPWIKRHPNLTADDQARACPTCRSKNLCTRGTFYSQSGRNIRFTCKDCGAWFIGLMTKKGLVMRS